MIKKKVRLKITDFLGTSVEENVMSLLTMVQKETPTFTVLLWYEKKGVNKESLLEFRKKYSSEIELLGLEIIQIIGVEEYIWYDIISVEDKNKLEHYKFRSIYDTIDDIIYSIMEFNSMIKFDTQKNNGYKNAKDRNYRFKTMGRQIKD